MLQVCDVRWRQRVGPSHTAHTSHINVSPHTNMYWRTVTGLENDYEGDLLGKRSDPLPDWGRAVSTDPRTHS